MGDGHFALKDAYDAAVTSQYHQTSHIMSMNVPPYLSILMSF